ncbi:MAG: hypothetical protein WAU57_04425 [Xanthobacteraceae bacterium]
MKNAEKYTKSAPRSKPDDPAQYKRFLEAAREHEADETEEGADRAFKKIISKPSPKKIAR